MYFSLLSSVIFVTDGLPLCQGGRQCWLDARGGSRSSGCSGGERGRPRREPAGRSAWRRSRARERTLSWSGRKNRYYGFRRGGSSPNGAQQRRPGGTAPGGPCGSLGRDDLKRDEIIYPVLNV